MFLFDWSAVHDARSFGREGFCQDRGEPTPQRGGRSKRLVPVTATGVKAAADFFGAIPGIREAAWTTKPFRPSMMARKRWFLAPAVRAFGSG